MKTCPLNKKEGKIKLLLIFVKVEYGVKTKKNPKPQKTKLK